MTPFSRRLRELKATRPHDDPIWAVNSKLDARATVTAMGVRVPELYQVADNPAHLTPPEAGTCVVKPNDGCSAVGVLPLRHEGEGRYRSLLGDGTDTWSGWLQWLGRQAARPPRTRPHPDNWRGPWLVEELVGDGTRLPDEWKCYVVGGAVQFSIQIRRDPEYPRNGRRSRTAHRDRDWRLVPGGIKHGGMRYDPSLPGPRHPEALTATAERIARELPTPFVRIDLYEDTAGPVFGEITPEPGGGHSYRLDWDRRMGEAWMNTETALATG